MSVLEISCMESVCQRKFWLKISDWRMYVWEMSCLRIVCLRKVLLKTSVWRMSVWEMSWLRIVCLRKRGWMRTICLNNVCLRKFCLKGTLSEINNNTVILYSRAKKMTVKLLVSPCSTLEVSSCVSMLASRSPASACSLNTNTSSTNHGRMKRRRLAFGETNLQSRS